MLKCVRLTRSVQRIRVSTSKIPLQKTIPKRSRFDDRAENLEPVFDTWQQEPDSSEDVLSRQKATELFEQGNVSEAVALLDKLVAKDNTNVNNLHAQSSIICLVPGRYEEALKNISKAITFTPKIKGAELWATKAFILYLGKDYDQAVLCAKFALTRKPKLVSAHFAMGLALSGLKQYYPSLTNYDTAAELCPSEVEICYWRGQSLYYLDRKEEAYSWLKTSPLEKSTLRGNFYKGINSFLSGDYSSAIQNFSVAKAGKAWNPNDTTDLQSWKGDSYLKLGQPEKALNCYSEAIKLAPKDALSHHGLGEALRLLNRVDEAKASFQAAAQIDPNYYKSDYLRIKQKPTL